MMDDNGAVPIPIEPELDLHAFAPKEIPAVVNDYIDDAAVRNITLVRLVHGRGRGIQRVVVQTTLDRHPLVVEFWDDSASHLGATIARVKRSP
jgi:dsDNA-specific endonuclease/ATPase MutS2